MTMHYTMKLRRQEKRLDLNAATQKYRNNVWKYRKLEHPEKTYTDTERTCHLHTESTARIQTKDLLAVRQLRFSSIVLLAWAFDAFTYFRNRIWSELCGIETLHTNYAHVA